MSRADGGQAYPRTLSAEERESHAKNGLGPAPFYFGGMTLRDYFAAKVLASMIASSPIVSAKNPGITCAAAYQFADALLAERAK